MAALMEFLLAREAELSGAAAKATAEMEELEQAPGKMFNAKIRLHRALGEIRGMEEAGKEKAANGARGATEVLMRWCFRPEYGLEYGSSQA